MHTHTHTHKHIHTHTHAHRHVPQQLPVNLKCLLGEPHTLEEEELSAEELPHSHPYGGYNTFNTLGSITNSAATIEENLYYDTHTYIEHYLFILLFGSLQLHAMSKHVGILLLFIYLFTLHYHSILQLALYIIICLFHNIFCIKIIILIKKMAG